MKYDKPALTVLGSACAGIESTAKISSTNDADGKPSTPAYEADE